MLAKRVVNAMRAETFYAFEDEFIPKEKFCPLQKMFVDVDDSNFWKRVVLDDGDVKTNSKQRENPVTCVADNLEQVTQDSGRPGSPVNVA